MVDDYKNKILNLSLKQPPIFKKNDQYKYINDWRGQYSGETIAVLRPVNKIEVTKILEFANSNTISVIPQGGNTGLCGGATPEKNNLSILINLEKLDKVLDFDPMSKTITVESGVILSKIHEIVEKSNLLFPLNLGAKGSCMIGGNLSTNAGGINVLKYGNTRDLCLGIEVVLPSGKTLNLLNNLRKDNTGYDLKNIFIGAEGTLGIITAASFKLFSLPKLYITSFVETNNIRNAIKLLNLFQNNIQHGLEAFELTPKVFWEVAKNNIENIKLPLGKLPEMGVLIEISSSLESEVKADRFGNIPLKNKLEAILSEALEKKIISDATICKNENERNHLWFIRENSADSEKKELEKRKSIKCLKHDISLPIKSIESFHIEVQKMLNAEVSGTRTIFFGHLGDGNLHYNIYGNGELPDGFQNKSEKITENLYEIVKSKNGSFSAEHGIGQLRKKSLKIHKDPVAYSLMKQIKKQIDPKNIMNPGKIFV